MRFTDVALETRDLWIHVRKTSAAVRKCVHQEHPGETAEAIRRARAEIDTYGEGQVEITVGIDPTATDPIPGVDWSDGDELFADGAWREAEAWAFSIEDKTGKWTDVPQFGATFDTPEQRNARAIRHIGGLTAGSSKLARPIASNPPPDVRPDSVGQG